MKLMITVALITYFPTFSLAEVGCCASDRQVERYFQSLSNPRAPQPPSRPPSGGGGNPGTPSPGEPNPAPRPGAPPVGGSFPRPRLPDRSYPGPIVITDSPRSGPSGGGAGPVITSNPSQLSRADLSAVFRELLNSGVTFNVQKAGMIPADNSRSTSATPNTAEDRNWQLVLTNQVITHHQLATIQERLNDLVGQTRMIASSLGRMNRGAADKSARPATGAGDPDPKEMEASPSAQPEGKDPLANKIALLMRTAKYARNGSQDWLQVADIPAHSVTAAGPKNMLARKVYWNNSSNQRGTIRIVELYDSQNKLKEALVLAKSHTTYMGRQWLAYFYQSTAKGGKLVEQNLYYGSPLPNACLNCHGGSNLKNFGPTITAPDYKPQGWFFH